MFVKLFPDSYFSCKSFHAYDMHMSYLGMNELLYYDVIFRETSAISTGSASGGFDSKIWVWRLYDSRTNLSQGTWIADV